MRVKGRPIVTKRTWVGTVTNEAEPDSAKEETMTSEHVQRLAEWLRNGNFYVPTTDEQITSFAQEALDASGATARIEELEKENLYLQELKELGWVEGATRQAAEWKDRADQAEKRIEEWKEIAKDSRYSNEFLGNVVRAALSQAQQSQESE